MRYKPFKLRLIILEIIQVQEMSVNKAITIQAIRTDFMYQRSTTNNDNRRQFVIQNHYFTFQRQYNTNHLDLQIQFMQLQIEQMQAQINNLSSNNPPPDDSGIGTM